MNAAEDRRRAGIFLLSALAVLLLVVGTLAGVRLLSREDHYIVEVRGESVAGLEVSGPVKYNGVPVGKVHAIRLHPRDLDKIHVEIALHSGFPVKLDTRARLSPQGITGLAYVDLYGSTTEAPDLEEGDVIPTDPSFMARVGGIAADLSDLVATMNRFVKNNEENLTWAIADFRESVGTIRAVLEKVDGAVDVAAEAVTEAREGMKEIRAEVRAAGVAVRRALGELEAALADPELRGLAGKASATLDRVEEKVAAADVAGIVDRVQEVLDRFLEVEESMDRAARAVAVLAEQGQEDVGAVLADVRAATANVKALTRSLRDDPSRILTGRPAAGKPVPDRMPPPREDPR